MEGTMYRGSLNSLIIRINHMLKKVEIDDSLTCLLDEFLEKLQQYNLFLSNGIFNTNFTEAALLLQSSTELYCKKVDLLWDIIIDYQKRMVLNEKQNNNNGDGEIEKLEERKRKYKRKRKIDANQIQQQQQQNTKLTDFSYNLNEFNDYINQNYEQNDLLSIWNNYIDNNLNNNNYSKNYSRNQTALFLPEDILRNIDDDEYIGRYDQFHITTIIPELFNNNNNSNNNDNSIIKTDNGLNSNNSSILNENCCNNCIVHLEPLPDSVFIEKLRRNSCFVNLEKLPNHLIEEKLRKSFDSGFNQSFDSDYSIEQSYVLIERLPQSIINEKLNKIKRIKSISQDSAFFDDFNDDDDDNNTSVNNNNNNNSLCCGSGSTIIIPNNNNNKKNSTKLLKNINDSGEKPIKRRRISEKLIKRYSTGNTVLSRDFEQFYFDQYKTAEGEGIPVRPEFSDYENNNDSEGDDDDDDDVPTEYDNSAQNIVSNRLELSQIDDDDDNDDNDEGFISPSTSQFNSEEIPHQQYENSSQNSIREWRTFILSKLKNLENRSKFDIHQYGTKIIESSNIGETRLFKDIVEDEKKKKKKDVGECARYFLSTLQLANTNNIKFSGVLSGQLSNDTLKITVVDKTRYHELLDDYQAPSEEVFRSKFERIKAINPDVLLHSTPYNSNGGGDGAPPSKRPKIIKCPKKIQFTYN